MNVHNRFAEILRIGYVGAGSFVTLTDSESHERNLADLGSASDHSWPEVQSMLAASSPRLLPLSIQPMQIDIC